MDKLDIVLYVVTGGFALMALMWHFINAKIEKLEDFVSMEINKLDNKINYKIDKLDEKLTDVDRRLCRLEGAFSSKDCCMIKEDNQMRKIE